MIETSTLLLYLVAVVLIMLTPGPDMLLVISAAASQGVRASVYMAFGIALSRSVHVLLSALGIASLLAASPTAFEVIRYIGALYLLWLAWHALSSIDCQTAPVVVRACFWSCFRKGLFTNLLNPKALVFCSLFLPQFIVLQRDDVLAQFALLGSILVGCGLLLDLLYALAASHLGRRLAVGRGNRHQWLQSALFAGLAVRLILMENGASH